MILLTPGPTPVLEDVREAMATPSLHHRTPEFELIFKSAREKLINLFNMDDALMLASTGTGAMEATVLSLCKSKALSINAGKFGERFGKIAKAHGVNSVELKYDWNTPALVEDIVKIIKEDKAIDALYIQVCESSGGLRHPVEKIAKEVKKIRANVMIIADGITAVGVENIDTINIDAMITGSQKALMLPPGLSMIGLNKDAITKIESRDIGYYFNLKSELKKQRENTTAYTAATTLIIGLEKVLEKIEAVGYNKFYALTKQRAEATLKALESIGLDIYPISPAIAMSTVYTEHANQIRKILKEKYSVNIAGGQDHLSGKIFRINNMGFVQNYEISWVLNAIELALEELKIREFDGKANRVFLQGMK